MTTLTIIDEILVLLDDEQPHSLEDMKRVLTNRTKQTISSTLGRLLTKGWVDRGVGRLRGHYNINQTGRNYVTNFLDQMKVRTDNVWDGSWEQVVFTIPERDRKRRDDLRALLVEQGYGRLHGWLWLSPWSHRSTIEQYLLATKSEHDVTILLTGTLDTVTNNRLARLFEWDWQTLQKDYEKFIADAQAYLAKHKKSSYEARCIVYRYAKVLATDPKLPDTLPQHILGASQAYDLYIRVRPFCYQ